MRVFLGMILGALLLTAGIYVYDSSSTSTVANGQAASANRTIVNWDVAATEWNGLKTTRAGRLGQAVVEVIAEILGHNNQAPSSLTGAPFHIRCRYFFAALRASAMA